jgi:signal peptide peptidase SppA
MKHVRFVSRLLNRPQMIAPAAGAAVLTALVPGVRLDGWDGDEELIERRARTYSLANGMAIIPVVGELVHRGGTMEAMSGLTSYQALADMVSDALSDDSVSSLLLDVDSPGGEAPGCLDFASWLAGQRGAKPIWASVNQRACSAAYAIACAADRVIIGESAYAGSIGVVWYHADISKALTTAGVKVTFITAGARKLAGYPEMPLSPEDAAMVERTVTSEYDRFCQHVADCRGISVDAVKATEAAVYLGRDAVAAGLADSIATHEEAVMALATQTAPTGARTGAAARTSMSAPKPKEPEIVSPAPLPPPPDAPQAEPEQAPAVAPADVPPNLPRYDPPSTQPFAPAEALAVAQACERAGFPALTSALLGQRASLPQVQERLTAAASITEAARLSGQPLMGPELVAAGVSLETARGILASARVSADQAIGTDAAHGDKAKEKAGTGLAAGPIYGRLNSTITPQRRRA